ncbi:hypothetical protein V8C86DRAFT_2491763 [Haematococcus lacustris]
MQPCSPFSQSIELPKGLSSAAVQDSAPPRLFHISRSPMWTDLDDSSSSAGDSSASESSSNSSDVTVTGCTLPDDAAQGSHHLIATLNLDTPSLRPFPAPRACRDPSARCRNTRCSPKSPTSRAPAVPTSPRISPPALHETSGRGLHKAMSALASPAGPKAQGGACVPDLLDHLSPTWLAAEPSIPPPSVSTVDLAAAPRSLAAAAPAGHLVGCEAAQRQRSGQAGMPWLRAASQAAPPTKAGDLQPLSPVMSQPGTQGQAGQWQQPGLAQWPGPQNHLHLEPSAGLEAAGVRRSWPAHHKRHLEQQQVVEGCGWEALLHSPPALRQRAGQPDEASPLHEFHAWTRVMTGAVAGPSKEALAAAGGRHSLDSTQPPASAAEPPTPGCPPAHPPTMAPRSPCVLCGPSPPAAVLVRQLGGRPRLNPRQQALLMRAVVQREEAELQAAPPVVLLPCLPL